MFKSPLTLLQNFDKDQYCQFCDRNVNDTVLYGPIYKFEEIVAHYFCLLLSSNIQQNGKDAEGILGFLPEDIQKEIGRGKKLSCSYCRKKGASIGCAVKSCKTTFHLPCGVSKQALSLFFDKFPSYCYKHRSWISLPELGDVHLESKTCLICLENLTLPQSTVTWSTCCKNAWYHKRCIQEVALNSGYYFRCPSCNNEKLFRKQMLDFGIYIPNQDASWEQEPNAYSSFYERYDHCDASICHCPWGRDSRRREGSWQIILCYQCLQKGIHKRCAGRLKHNLWSCSSPTCLNEYSTEAGAVVPASSSRVITTRITRSSSLPSSKSENKENYISNLSAGNIPNASFLHRRTVEVLNGTLTPAHLRTPSSKTLRSLRERFIERETRGSSSFAFNLPQVTSANRRPFTHIVRRRRSLRFSLTKVNKEKKIRRNEVQRTKKCNQHKRNVNNCCPTNARYSKSNSPKDILSGRRRRRKFVVDKQLVSVYPAIMRSMKDFVISL